MEKRTTPGQHVPTGRNFIVFKCEVCESERTTATWKAHDGSEGTWCLTCHDKQIKSPVKSVEVPDMKWVPGTMEVKCCGSWILCDRFTNTCDQCHRDYNSSGQLLGDRSQWGEETGETAADILGL